MKYVLIKFKDGTKQGFKISTVEKWQSHLEKIENTVCWPQSCIHNCLKYEWTDFIDYKQCFDITHISAENVSRLQDLFDRTANLGHAGFFVYGEFPHLGAYGEL